MDQSFLNEYRCKCGKLLFKGIFLDVIMEMKCLRCGEINKIGTLKFLDDEENYLLIVNNTGVISNASDSACRILGYHSNELIGKHFTIVNPTMPKEIGEKFFGDKSVLSEDNYFKLNTNHQTKDGRIFSVEVNLKLYYSNKKGRYVLISVKLIKGDEVINKKANRFVDNVCDFYFDLDKNAIGECISPSMETIFGITQSMAIGKSYFDVIPKETKNEAKKIYEHFSKDRLPFKCSNNNGIWVNNKDVPYELYFTPKFDDFGNFGGYRVLGWVLK